MNELKSQKITSFCECCGSTNVSADLHDSQFEYKHNKDIVVLDVRLPVYTCTDCDFAYTAKEAELLKHNVICKYLNILTPDEISTIRGNYNLTVNDLAKLTGIGSASLTRWEAGKLHQSKSHDTLLRLLCKKVVMDELTNLRKTTQCSGVAQESAPNFLFLVQNKQVSEKALKFSL